MKKNDGNQNTTQNTTKRIFRKKNIDDTVYRKDDLGGIDLSDFGNFSATMDEDEENFDDVEFSFTDEDIKRFQKQNLEQSEMQENTEKKKDTGRGFFGRKKKDSNKEAKTKRQDETSYDLDLKKKTNKEIMRVTYVIVLVFIGMIAYYVHFNVVDSEEVVNNVHNSRLAKLEEKIIRGTIYSADGEVLAESVVNDDGTTTRYYPYGCTFAHVVGTSTINQSGIELSCDYDLITSDEDIMHKIIDDISGQKNQGNNVTTTLNAKLQQVAHDALGEETGAVIALEPSTGKVLAMVSKPDYDPNTLEDTYDEIVSEENSKVLLNQATQGTFTPGSIFKIVTSLAYIRNGSDVDDYSYYCDGGISLETGDDTHVLRCYDGEVHGQVDLTESFAESCNASFANIGTSELTTDELKSTAKSLLFNQTLPTSFTTSKSKFSLSDSDSEWMIGATSIGQGNTTISPIHAAMIVSAIANNGKLMEPYVVDAVTDAEGNTLESTDTKSCGSLMSASEANKLKKMMKAVVDEGTGYKLADRSYDVAGKTGTAEVDGSGNNAWFVGFAPADDPQIVVCVLVENAGTSSSVAVPIAGEIFDAYLGD